MTPFGTHKVSGGTTQEVAHMVENYFRGRELNPRHQAIPSSEGCGWWLTEGSARVYIFVHDSPTGPVLRITSPIVFIPNQNCETFYRKLLDLNNSLTNCHLAIYDNYVLVVCQQQTTGISQEELDADVWNVAYVADLLDNKLATEFHTELYHD